MTIAGLERLFRSLNDAGVRYIVVGGLAVIGHGHFRLTSDADLVVELEPTNLTRALDALEGIGYRPRVPVPMRAFADAPLRESWIREKHMIAFQLINDDTALPPVDIFAAIPFDFAQEYEAATAYEFLTGVAIPIISLPTLIRMKEEAARDKDLWDIRMLKKES